MHQIDIEDYYPHSPGYKGTETSKAAAKKIKAHAKTQKERVLECLREYGKAMTAEQVSKLTGVNLTAVRSRLSELKQEGYADHAGVAKGRYTTIVKWMII